MPKQGARLIMEQNIKTKPKQTLGKSEEMEKFDKYILGLRSMQNVDFIFRKHRNRLYYS